MYNTQQQKYTDSNSGDLKFMFDINWEDNLYTVLKQLT